MSLKDGLPRQLVAIHFQYGTWRDRLVPEGIGTSLMGVMAIQIDVK